jgi:hypothetical protein
MNAKKLALGGIGVLVVVYFGVKMYASGVAEKQIDDAISGVAVYANIEHGNVSVDLLGLDVHISDVMVVDARTGQEFTIDEVVIHDLDGDSRLPTFMDVSFKGIKGLDGVDMIADQMKELGYEDGLVLNANVRYDYSRENRDFNVKRLTIAADGMADVEANAHFGNVDLEPEKLVALLVTYPYILVHSAEISYQDHSLAERVMTLTAKHYDVKVDEFREGVIKEIEQQMTKTKNNFTKGALKEVQGFIEKPRRLSISVSPSEALPIGRIMGVADPDQVIEMLNVKVGS